MWRGGRESWPDVIANDTTVMRTSGGMMIMAVLLLVAGAAAAGNLSWGGMAAAMATIAVVVAAFCANYVLFGGMRPLHTGTNVVVATVILALLWFGYVGRAQRAPRVSAFVWIDFVRAPMIGDVFAMIDTPQITETAVQLAALIRLTIPREEIRSVMGPGIGEVTAAVAAQGVGPAGPVFSHHLRMDPDIFDFEVGVPVTKAVTPVGRVKPGQLPAATVARTVYQSPYEGLGAAWGEFVKWIAANGHTPAADLWECYVAGPESNPDPAHWRTQLNRPLIR